MAARVPPLSAIPGQRLIQSLSAVTTTARFATQWSPSRGHAMRRSSSPEKAHSSSTSAAATTPRTDRQRTLEGLHAMTQASIYLEAYGVLLAIMVLLWL